MACKKNGVFLAPEENIIKVFGDELIAQAKELCNITHVYLPDNNTKEIIKMLEGTEIILSTWGMPRMSKDILEGAEKLKIIIYGASSVKSFVTDELFNRGITVTTSAGVNGRIVAEFTLALITFCIKNAWTFVCGKEKTPVFFRRKKPWPGIGGFLEAAIGIIGASSVGKAVINLLSFYPCKVLVYDPYVSEKEIEALGARKCELEELIRTSDIVSLHAPNLPELQGMINAELLAKMKDGSWFINTARGALVDEDALIRELKTGRISACLDVTAPEPPGPGSPLYHLSNVILTPHMAGAIGTDCKRLGRYCIEELKRYVSGMPPLSPVHKDRLSIMG